MVLPRKKSTHWQTDLQRVGKGSGRLRKVGNQSHFTLPKESQNGTANSERDPSQLSFPCLLVSGFRELNQ